MTTKKTFKYDSERRADRLTVGDPVWVFTSGDVYEAVVVEPAETYTINGKVEQSPFYKVRDVRHTEQRPRAVLKEYRTDLYRRPAELAELIDAVEQTRDELTKHLSKLEDLQYEIENTPADQAEKGGE